MSTFKFNRTSLSKANGPIPDPTTGKTPNQAFHWDSQTPGFGIRITSTGATSYILDTRVNGRKKRFTIGRLLEGGSLTPEKARKLANALLAEISAGRDPAMEKAKQKIKAVTLSEALRKYTEGRKSLKQSTIDDMYKVIERVLGDWLEYPLTKITSDMVFKRHSEHGRKHSEAKANAAMRYLRAIFNFFIETHRADDGSSIIQQNPVSKLSLTKSWFKDKRRQKVLKKDELKPWLSAVIALQSETPRDYLITILFTGLRKNEGLGLLWEDVDFENRTLTVRDTKNHKDHTLPLSDYLYKLLIIRHKHSSLGNPYVFEGKKPNSQYKGPATALRRVKEESGINVSIHDLRRTFSTVAESLDISSYAIKQLLNHSMTEDVTAGYIIKNIERLRSPMEEISQYLIRTSEIG